MYLVPVFSAGKSAFARAGAAFIWTVAVAAGQDFSDRSGTAEFQYLDNLVFARPAGLAGAYTAMAQGIDAVGYNPAGVAKAGPGRSIAGTLRYHMLDIASGNATYAYPGATGMSYAFSAAYINYGRIDELDEEGNASGRKILPSSFNPSLTAARKVGENLRFGASLRGLSEYLGDFNGSSVAFGWAIDAGMQYQPNVRNLGFGIAVVNAGRKESPHYVGGDKGGMLPLALKGGMFYFPLDLPKAKVALDLEVPFHESPRVAGGAEYALMPSFTIRAGGKVDWAEADYLAKTITDERPERLRGGIALKGAGGFTFAADDLAVDYAVQYWHGLSWVHALTLKHSVL